MAGTDLDTEGTAQSPHRALEIIIMRTFVFQAAPGHELVRV